MNHASGSVTAVNVYAPDGLAARIVGTTTTQYAFDPQGNVSQRLDASGSVLSSSVYDAYGQENSTATPADPFGYDARWGYYEDRETGLAYCQNRYYDPASGRWLNRDPIGVLGGFNVYGYCEGGPVGRTDLDGRRWQTIAVAGGFILLGILLAPETGRTGTAIAWGAACGALGGAAAGATEYGYGHPGARFDTAEYTEAWFTGGIAGGILGGLSGLGGLPKPPLRNFGPSFVLAKPPIVQTPKTAIEWMYEGGTLYRGR